MDTGFLIFGKAKQMVPVKHLYLHEWIALYEGRWRKVHIQVKRTYIVYMGKKITIEIDGV